MPSPVDELLRSSDQGGYLSIVALELLRRKGIDTSIAWTPRHALDDAHLGSFKNLGNRYPEKEGVILLSGGNPQVARANRDLPVREYIAAIPGWKRDLGERRDALIAQSVQQCARP